MEILCQQPAKVQGGDGMGEEGKGSSLASEGWGGIHTYFKVFLSVPMLTRALLYMQMNSNDLKRLHLSILQMGTQGSRGLSPQGTFSVKNRRKSSVSTSRAPAAAWKGRCLPGNLPLSSLSVLSSGDTCVPMGPLISRPCNQQQEPQLQEEK